MKFIDSSGPVDISRFKWLMKVGNMEFIRDSLNNLNAWSIIFDRKHIDVIEEKLDIDLSDIKRKK
jgi:hypothetical protein